MINAIRFLCGWIRVITKILKPGGGAKALAAENIVLRQQLITLSRNHKRSPKLTTSDRIIFGFLTSIIRSKRLPKIAILIKPTTLLKFYKALVNKKYQLLFSNKSGRNSGQRGPSDKLKAVIIEMKQRNPRYSYLRIAMQIQEAFGIELDPGVVRRVLNKDSRKSPKNDGPSWLTFLGHMKDSLWSIDFFRCESIHLRSHWVMLVMDQFTRKIIGFGVHIGDLNGMFICCMFDKILSGKPLPTYLSSDHDPLFNYYRWQANLRILEINEIKTIPYTPISHLFAERLIGTIRREYLAYMLFWNAKDLENKLQDFQQYYNERRGHSSIDRLTPVKKASCRANNVININNYRWKASA